MNCNLILEALMLVSVGVAWPLVNLRMLRSRNAEGMGAAFTAIILCGYIAGALAKWMAAAAGAEHVVNARNEGAMSAR